MLKIFQSVFFFCSLFFALSSHACWNLKERSNIDGFAELDDVLILSLKDAINCKPLVDVNVKLGALEYKTDALGYIRLPMQPFASQMDARMLLTAGKSGYITLATELVVEAGTVLNRRLVLSPVLPPGKTRFVLQWADEPEDLDLHLKGPDFHISYRNMKSAENRARLDIDELEGYGPETITLDKVDTRHSYELWVYNYSNNADYKGVELIYIYSGDRLIKEIRLSASQKRSVKVLQIQNGNFEYFNVPTNLKP
ncbi:MAG: hypothetical protein DIZ80_05650 [endosymbiont of Galathealinum brachiosum]|uniref:Uncharacterized protein n=1 Tax=endosymbiont of Galathealinum brachiosum TaxID=2200906 RepID=A0A370DKV2_9GAMM|nr:MAG: hypothetical protein DIZ80_05650 [endosymbiont of Galathealinum brachiosum]